MSEVKPSSLNELKRLVEISWWGYLRLWSELDGVTRLTGDGWEGLADSGGRYNILFNVSVPSDRVDRFLDRALVNYEASTPGLRCWVGPGSPPNLPVRLAKIGFREKSVVTGMYLRPADLVEKKSPAGFELKEVFGLEGTRATAGRFMSIMGADPDQAERAARLYADQPHGPGRVWSYYRVDHNGLPAAGVSRHNLRPGIDQISFVFTEEDQRGRGLGRAAVQAAVRIAFDRGATAVVLQATKLGRPVYQSLGFRSTDPFSCWVRD